MIKHFYFFKNDPEFLRRIGCYEYLPGIWSYSKLQSLGENNIVFIMLSSGNDAMVTWFDKDAPFVKPKSPLIIKWAEDCMTKFIADLQESGVIGDQSITVSQAES